MVTKFVLIDALPLCLQWFQAITIINVIDEKQIIISYSDFFILRKLSIWTCVHLEIKYR